MMLSDLLSWCWLAGPVLQRNRHLRSGRVCLLSHTPTRSPPAFPCFGYVSCLAVCIEMLSFDSTAQVGGWELCGYVCHKRSPLSWHSISADGMFGSSRSVSKSCSSPRSFVAEAAGAASAGQLWAKPFPAVAARAAWHSQPACWIRPQRSAGRHHASRMPCCCVGAPTTPAQLLAAACLSPLTPWVSMVAGRAMVKSRCRRRVVDQLSDRHAVGRCSSVLPFVASG